MQNHLYSATIVDNESHAREIIGFLLDELFPDIEVLNQAHSVASGVIALTTQTTDLVFLDVEMGDGTGFDVLEQLRAQPPIVIFVTSFDKYAIKALRAAAFDYILKPINRKDFALAVNRALQSLELQKDDLPSTQKADFQLHSLEKIALPNLNGLRFVETQKISRCEANGNYTQVHFTDGTHEMISRTLRQFQTDLIKHGFFRVHHKHLVNVQHISAYQKGKAGGAVVMQDGAEVEVSLRKKSDLIQLFSSKK